MVYKKGDIIIALCDGNAMSHEGLLAYYKNDIFVVVNEDWLGLLIEHPRYGDMLIGDKNNFELLSLYRDKIIDEILG